MGSMSKRLQEVIKCKEYPISNIPFNQIYYICFALYADFILLVIEKLLGPCTQSFAVES